MATIPADPAVSSTPAGAFVGRPRVRRDVQLFANEQEGYVLRQARTGREFKLGRWERLVVQLLDGTRRPKDVCRELLAAHHVRCDPRVIERFIAQLEQAQLLTDGRDDDASPVAVERRGMLYMARLVQPHHWARRLTARFRWVNLRIVSIIAVTLCGVAALIVATNLSQISTQIAYAWTTRGLAFAFGLGLVAALAHESSHALAAVSYGAHLVSAGFGVYWFRPCLFCEIRGLESLPRAKRLVVSGAGLMSDLIQASLYLLAWRMLPAGMLGLTSLLTAALLGIRVAINLNPLVKLDGYYLLVDAIGHRDLRESAFRALADRLRDVASGAWRRTRPERRALRSGETLYALLATTYLGASIVVIVVAFRRWLDVNVRDPTVVVAMLLVFALATLTDRAFWGRPRARRHR